jgi:hypothetical protein
MASIYDLARITAGDPMSQVKEGSREAAALLAQYQHQKEIIDEINKEIKAAEKKASKNKFGWGLGGSILGGLLGAGLTGLTGGVGAPAILAKLAPYMSTLGAGLGSGIMEKQRQDYVGATRGLKNLEKKLKGRKQLEDVEGVREGIEGGLDQMVMQDALNAMTMDMIMPKITKAAEEGFGQSVVPTDMLDPEGVSQEGFTTIDSWGDNLAIDPEDTAFYEGLGYRLEDFESGPGWYKPETYTQKRFGDAGGLDYVDTPDGTIEMMIEPNYSIETQVIEEDFIPIKRGNARSQSFVSDPVKVDYVEPNTVEIIGAKPASANMMGIDVPLSNTAHDAMLRRSANASNMMSQIPGLGAIGELAKQTGGMELFKNPYIQNLLKLFGPSVMGVQEGAFPRQRRFTGPTFRNPYGGGGGY